ncbi:unnamed protein product, partial [Symbiodinium microadriaticum]
MFLTKGNWHIEWKNLPYAKANVTHDLVNVYDWVMLPASVGEKFYQNGAIDLSKFPCHQLNGSFKAQRQWVTASNGKQKLDNYFNRQFTDHISTQNGVKDNNGEVPAGVANVPRKWMWTVPRLREESMGIIRMPLNDPMMMASHGPPLLCLGEMAEWSRIATMKHCGLIEWRLMGQS